MTLNRKTLIAATATLATALTMTSALAANGETPLGQCYNMVISSCNQTSNHPEACANNGMDACDDEYGNQVGGGASFDLRAPEKRGILIGLLLPAVQKAREAAAR